MTLTTDTLNNQTVAVKMVLTGFFKELLQLKIRGAL